MFEHSKRQRVDKNSPIARVFDIQNKQKLNAEMLGFSIMEAYNLHYSKTLIKFFL